jgi:5-methylcytosine-specific restriction endonuclease McrA
MKNFKSNKPCIVCGISVDGAVTFHHIFTRKSRPDLTYAEQNLISVCAKHHNMFHAKGTNYMANTFNSVKEFLIENGWEFNDYLKKWIIVDFK